VRRAQSARIEHDAVKAALLAFGMLLAAPARAGDAEKARPKANIEETEFVRPATERSFYGWQILLVGGLGGALTAASMALPDRPIGGLPATAGFTVGLPIYVFGGPVIHWMHGHFTEGLLSFGANIAIPFAAGIAAMGTLPDRHTVGFARGAAVGALVVPVLDALILGWEDVPTEVMTQGVGSSIGVALSPAIEVQPQGRVVLGLRAVF
jgi:hypothetical protein